jgi:hypothetical protein
MMNLEKFPQVIFFPAENEEKDRIPAVDVNTFRRVPREGYIGI